MLTITAHVLAGLAALARLMGRRETAATLAEAAEHLHVAVRLRRDPAFRVQWVRAASEA